MNTDLTGSRLVLDYRFNSYNSKDIQLLNVGLPTGDFIHAEKFVQTVTSSLVWRFKLWP